LADGRKPATLCEPMDDHDKPATLDVKRLACDFVKVARALRYNEQKLAFAQLENKSLQKQEGSQFRCRGQQMDVVTGHS